MEVKGGTCQWSLLGRVCLLKRDRHLCGTHRLLAKYTLSVGVQQCKNTVIVIIVISLLDTVMGSHPREPNGLVFKHLAMQLRLQYLFVLCAQISLLHSSRLLLVGCDFLTLESYIMGSSHGEKVATLIPLYTVTDSYTIIIYSSPSQIRFPDLPRPEQSLYLTPVCSVLVILPQNHVVWHILNWSNTNLFRKAWNGHRVRCN